MFISVRMTTCSLWMDFRHIHFCTETTLSFWMDFRHVHFCTNNNHLFLSGLSSFTFLYGWLPPHFEWIVVIYISARMTTISFWTVWCHAHFCTNDYHLFLNRFSSFTSLVWMTTIFFKGLSSFTFLYEWLPFLFERIVVMHISVRRTTISFWIDFRHAHFCTNDYHFILYGFSSCIFCAMTFHILCVLIFVMHFLCKWLSILMYIDFRHAYSVRMTFRNLLVFHDVCNGLKRVN